VRSIALLCGLLIATAVMPSEPADETISLDSVVDWFAADSDGKTDAGEVRRALEELERRLLGAGLDESLARALASPPFATIDDDPGAASRHALSRLRRFTEACARPEPGEQPQAAAVLEQVLDDPVFNRSMPEATLFQRGFHRIGAWFRRLLGTAGRIASENRLLASAFLIALLVAAVALVARQFAKWSRESRVDSGSDSIRMLDEILPDMSDLIARARRFAASGSGLASLRLLVRASIEALRSRTLLPDEPGLTDLEGVRILRRTAGAQVQRSFHELVEFHDRGVYGGAGVSPDVVERAIELTEKIVRRDLEATP